VRVVALEHDVVDADLVAQFHAGPVGDEAGELVEHRRHQQVDRGHHRVEAEQRDADEEVAVRGQPLRHPARAEVQRQPTSSPTSPLVTALTCPDLPI
jgi:hypothetical protein